MRCLSDGVYRRRGEGAFPPVAFGGSGLGFSYWPLSRVPSLVSSGAAAGVHGVGVKWRLPGVGVADLFLKDPFFLCRVLVLFLCWARQGLLVLGSSRRWFGCAFGRPISVIFAGFYSGLLL